MHDGGRIPFSQYACLILQPEPSVIEQKKFVPQFFGRREEGNDNFVCRVHARCFPVVENGAQRFVPVAYAVVECPAVQVPAGLSLTFVRKGINEFRRCKTFSGAECVIGRPVVDAGKHRKVTV